MRAAEIDREHDVAIIYSTQDWMSDSDITLREYDQQLACQEQQYRMLWRRLLRMDTDSWWIGGHW